MDGLARTGVQVVLDADPVGIVRGFAQADSAGQKFAATLGAISNVGQAGMRVLQGIGQAAERTARRTRNAGIGLGLSLVGATYGAIQFEAAMKNVATIDANVRDNFGKTSAQVVALSRILPQSAKELAEGYYDIASSGFAGSEAQNVLANSARAATAGLASTAEAGRAITAVLNSYGMSGAQAAKVSDLLFQTVNLGVVTFSELSGVIGDSVGLAAKAGIGFKEVGGAIATMTLSGVSASEAGTSLNRLVQSLIDPTEDLALAWSRLSNQTLTQALASQGLQAVMEKLRVASGGNVEVLMRWFNEVRAARGALGLMSNEGETYSRIMRGMDDATKGQGATQRALEQQMSSTAMQIKMLVNQFKSIGIEIGNALLPFVKSAVGTLRTFASAWNSIPGPIKSVISILGAVSSAVMVVTGVMAIFAAKALATTLVTKVLGTALNTGGGYISRWGGLWQRAGDQMATAGARMQQSTLRNLNILAPFTGTLNLVGNGFTRLGSRIATIDSPVSRAGAGLSRLGASLTGVASAIPKLAVALPALALGAVMIFSRLSSANQQADALIQDLTSGFDTNTYVGTARAIKAVSDELDRSSARAERWGHGIEDGKNQLKSLTAGLIVAGNVAPSLLGVDNLFGDPIGDIVERNKLIDEYNRLTQRQANLQSASARVWQNLSINQAGVADTYRNLIGRLPMLGKAAKNAGIDMDNAVRLSQGEVRKLTREFLNLQSKSGGALTDSTGFAIQQSAKAVEEFQKYVSKTVQSVTDAFYKDFSISAAIEEEGAAGEKQLKEFLGNSLRDNMQFVDNLEELMRRGLNPDTLLELATAGPAAAKNAIAVLLGQNSEALIQMTNDAVSAMRQMRIKLEIEAGLIAKAAARPQIAGNIDEAMRLQLATLDLGVHVSPDRLALMLGMDVKTVQAVATQFGLDLGEKIPASYESALSKMTPQAQEMMGRFFGAVTQQVEITDADAARVFTKLSTKGYQAAVELINNLNLVPEQKQILLDIIGGMAVKTELTNIGDKADEVGRKEPKVKAKADTAEAEENIRRLRNNIDGLHDKTVNIYANEHVTSAVNQAFNALSSIGIANGGIFPTVKKFARGGTENHQAQLARAGAWRIWAEPETGGEAYIPLAAHKRGRSLDLLEQVADMFGYGLHKMQDGGLSNQGLKIYGNRPGASSNLTIQTSVSIPGNIYGVDNLKQVINSVIDKRDEALAVKLSMNRG